MVPKCEESFQSLKKLLTTATIMKIAYPKKDFVVCTYTCIEILGEVIMKYNHVICYESWKLKEREKKYAIHALELAKIVHDLKMWRYYLMGTRFELKINHIILKYVFDQANLNFRQAR